MHDRDVNTQWATIVAALGGGLFGALAALGGGWVKGHYDIKAEQLRAVRASTDADMERRRQAYAQLVASARAVLRNQRQLRHVYASDQSADPEAREVGNRGSELIDALTEAVSLAEIVGSVTAQAGAAAIFDSARATGDMYVARSLELAAAQRQKRRPSALPAFDADAVDTNTAELDGAIDAFINEVRRDLRNLPPLDAAGRRARAVARRRSSDLGIDA